LSVAAEKRTDQRGAYHAIRLMLECVRNDPDNVRYYLLLGSLYQQVGDDQKKIQAWQRAYLLDPENPEAQRRMRELDKVHRPPVTRIFSPSPVRSVVISAVLIFIGALIMNMLDYVIPAQEESGDVSVADVSASDNKPSLDTLYPNSGGADEAPAVSENDNTDPADTTETDAGLTPDDPETIIQPEDDVSSDVTVLDVPVIPSELVDLLFPLDERGICFTGNVSIRSGPGLDYREIAKADDGDMLRITGQERRWFKILLADGTPGYITRTYVNLSRSRAELRSDGVLWVGENKGRHVVVRERPEKSSEVLDIMEPGKHVFVLKDEGEWQMILLPGDRLGYVYGRFINKKLSLE
jgi:SH3-like domain-containing protein